MAFWIVDASVDSYNGKPVFFILDDKDNVIEKCTKEQIDTYVNLGIEIGYKEGSIKENGTWVGKKTWDDCPILCRAGVNNHGYYVLRNGRLITTSVFTQKQHIKELWHDMKQRCAKFTKVRNKSYIIKGVYVDESFENFDNFYNWYISQPNFKYLKEADLQLDKDLKGKNYYGVDSCLLLPRYLNNLISKLTSDVKRDLPLCCKPNRKDWVEVKYNGTVITDDMKDTVYSDDYVLNMMQEFMRDRGIKTWNYATSIIDVGRKWLTFKRIALERFRAEAKRCYDKGWITLEAYNLCLAYDIKITD